MLLKCRDYLNGAVPKSHNQKRGRGFVIKFFYVDPSAAMRPDLGHKVRSLEGVRDCRSAKCMCVCVLGHIGW